MDDIEELQTVVLKSMTGLAAPADFEKNLIAATAASPALIEKMIEEMNHEIFEPIHDFVMSGGKAPDPLAKHGIELQPSDDVVPTPPKPMAAPLEIPTSPEPVVPKPQVKGSFDSFFVNTPTKTDHSMLK